MFHSTELELTEDRGDSIAVVRMDWWFVGLIKELLGEKDIEMKLERHDDGTHEVLLRRAPQRV